MVSGLAWRFQGVSVWFPSVEHLESLPFPSSTWCIILTFLMLFTPLFLGAPLFPPLPKPSPSFWVHLLPETLQATLFFL